MVTRLAATAFVCLCAALPIGLAFAEQGQSRPVARSALLTNARSLQHDVDIEVAKASTAQKFAASLSAADGQALQALCREAVARPTDAQVRQRFEELVARYRSVGADAIVTYCMAPSYAQLRRDVQGLASKLESQGDDAQLANVDLQNILQKQQQTLQMMSNISKMLYDTAMSVIRKMGG